MTEFFKGSVPCTIGQSLYHVSHDYLNILNSYPVITLTTPISTSYIFINAVTNNQPTGFDILLSSSPAVSGYSINWLINVPGTDCAEYINDKRYYSKVELGNAKLSRVHWKNVIAAPDLSPTGLQNNHNHDNRYFTQSGVLPVIDSRIELKSSYAIEADTLMIRNSNGRCQVNTPKTNNDVANKGYTDSSKNYVVSLLNNEIINRVNADTGLQTQVYSISGNQHIDEIKLQQTATIAASVSGLGYGNGVNLVSNQSISGQKSFITPIIFSQPTLRTIYFGDPSGDGSWALGVFGGNFVASERVSGTWIIKNVIS